MSVPPTEPSPAQPLPKGPDVNQTAQELSSVLEKFIENLSSTREHPHLVDSSQALSEFAGNVQQLHIIAIKAGG